MRPVTEEQWQDAVDTAHFLLKLEVGQLFKLIKGVPPQIDVEECVMILAEGAGRGIFPSSDISALLDATDELLSKCDKQFSLLNSEVWIGPQLWKLRCAALSVKIRRDAKYADRKVS